MERLLASYRAIPPTATVRLAKPTSNLFRARAKSDAPGLDTSGLTGVIAVDPDARTADVAGMCTYEDLVAATLPYGLSPLVVPQLKTITLGGAVTGLGIESASFRNGLPHESVLEMDILTGDRRGGHRLARRSMPTCSARFPIPMARLGYSVRLKIELESVKPFVALRHLRFHSLTDLVDGDGPHHRDRRPTTAIRVDYLDGVVFSADESYLSVGIQTSTPGPVSDYTGQEIYYRSIQHGSGAKHDRLTIHDYLWRWDTDWFWCSRAFGAQNPRIRRFWPRRYRRSSFYWKLIALRPAVRHRRPHREAQRSSAARTRRAGRRGADRAVRGVPGLVPGQRAHRADLVVPAAAARDRWPLYPMRPGHTYVNIGFWSSVPVGATEGETNRLIERKVSELDGHKSLYSDAYYSHDEFDELYGGEDYKTVKKTYDPDSRLLDLYAKAVQRR